MDFLIIQLYGPLASWGAPAVGESRPSSDHPTRGALLGLVAASLGIEREDASSQSALSQALRFAVRQITPGGIIRDFHTVQVPKRDKKAQYATRKDELGVGKDKLNTIISRREYRADGLWQVAVSLTPESHWSLEDLEKALREPAFTPYLGRRSCPLAAPLAPQKVQAEGIHEAFSRVSPLIHDYQSRLLGFDGQIDYFWEEHGDDLQVQDTRFPEDDVINRDRWQFRGRAEHHARIKEGL